MGYSKAAYILLAQVSIVSGIEVYVDPKNDIDLADLVLVGAKFITTHTNHAALTYRCNGSFHYLKIVGPTSPKGGGFYLSPKLKEDAFILWLDAFTKGFLGREIAVKLGAKIQPPYSLIEKLTYVDDHGPIPDLNAKFSKPLSEWGEPHLVDLPKPKKSKKSKPPTPEPPF